MPAGVVAVLAAVISVVYLVSGLMRGTSTGAWKYLNIAGIALGGIAIVVGIAGLSLDHQADETDNKTKGDQADACVITSYVVTFVSLAISITDLVRARIA
jgi:hypothetical protein